MAPFHFTDRNIRRLLALALFLMATVKAGAAPKACHDLLKTPVAQTATVEAEANRVQLTPKTRIAMAQMNNRVGDFEGNLKKMVAFTKKAALEEVDVLIFPEMAFSSYLVRDLVQHPEFLDHSDQALKEFIEQVRTIPNAPGTIIVGTVTRNKRATGREPQNSVVVIHEGK